MTRAEHIHALLEEYARQRSENEAELDRRIAEAEARDPEIARLRADSVRLMGDAVRALAGNASPEARAETARRMREQGRANNAEIRRRLKALGLPEDEFQLRVRCPLCRDTAYVGEAPSRFCSCFEARLRQRMTEDGSMADSKEQNFERFDLTRFPEEGGQRRRMQGARAFCEQYADSFPDTPIHNLVLTGKGGLGKTYLLNCIYARVTERGMSAVRVTAFRMHEAMRHHHYRPEESDDAFDALFQAPLLLIDDLGTEPMMKNISVEYLFLLLNERMNQNRHTVIATNLNHAQMLERYGERVTSRIEDRSRWTWLAFEGRDIRGL